MRYILLIYGDEAARSAMPDDDRHAMYAEYEKFANELTERGIGRGGDELASVTSATTVQERDGKMLVTDGPFAETKEQLGRVLHRRRRRPGHGDRAGREDPGRPRRLDRDPPHRRRGMTDAAAAVDRVFREEAGSGGRGVDPHHRRFRSRGGSRPGGLRDRAARVADEGHPGEPGRLDHHDGQEPGDRPAAARPGRSREDRRRRTARRPRGPRRRCARHPGRPAPPAVHVLPPRARDRRPGRAHAPDGRRLVDQGDRSRVPRPRADARPAAHAERNGRSGRRRSRTASRLERCCRSVWTACSRCSTSSSTKGMRRRSGSCSARSSATRRSGSPGWSTA